MKSMIFAAGLGTRLRPITDTMPKALVPVGGIPMLERVICKLRDAGIDGFVVNACHFKEQIINFLKDNDFGADVQVSLEDGTTPLETGGGIRHAESLLAGSERFLVHNVDILSNLDVQWFMQQDEALCNDGGGKPLATLLVTETEADRYLLFDCGMRLAGWTNVRTGEVKSPYPDFNPSLYKRYSFCGIHIISEGVFRLMDEWPEHFSIIDFYLRAAASQRICGVVAEDLELIDIGSPEKLALANGKIKKFI